MSLVFILIFCLLSLSTTVYLPCDLIMTAVGLDFQQVMIVYFDEHLECSFFKDFFDGFAC